MKRVWVSGAFDDLRSQQVRFLQEAARAGEVNILLWADDVILRLTGQPPEFPASERSYFLQALRWVSKVHRTVIADPHTLPLPSIQPGDTWVVLEQDDHPEKRAFCQQVGMNYQVIPNRDLAGFPTPQPERLANSGRKQALVTGSFDWLHTGHVRFFEEVSTLGDLTVIVGHDANIRLLKGEGHPLFKQAERLYMVQSIRYVHMAMLSTGSGWLDAEPELARLKPDLYVVNEDGDKPEKQAYCQQHAIEYVVLRRVPKDGLPPRSSTTLRGF